MEEICLAEEKPVIKDEIYEVEIISLGAKGDGVAKVKGFVVIVPGAEVQDKVRVRITNVREKVAFGEVVKEEAE